MSMSTVETVERETVTCGVRITVARTPDEAQALRPWFERLEVRNLDADLDFLLTLSRVAEGVVRPHVVLCELPEDRTMLIVARLEAQPGSGQRSRTCIRTLRLAFGGIIGALTAEDRRIVVEILDRVLSDGEADVVVVPQIELEDPLYAALRSAMPWWRTDHVPQEHVHWRAGIPDSLDAFLRARSSKTRSNVRYYRKKVLAEHGPSLEVREFREEAELDRVFEHLEAVAALTYQRGLGVGYSSDPLQRALMTLAAQQGWLRAWVLYLGDVPAAYWFGYCYRGTFSSVANGFNPAYSDLRIGQYLQIEVTERLCNDSEVTTFDWGTGDAEYKRRFGDQVVTVADVVLYGASIRVARANAARTVRLAFRRVARAWVAQTKLGARVKKQWRKRAETRAQSRAA